jgi:hypothetical protein
MSATFQEIVEAVGNMKEGTAYYYDREDRTLRLRVDPDMVGFANFWMERMLEEDPDRFAKLPSDEEIDPYGIMVSFVDTLPEEAGAFKKKLAEAVQGHTAFKRFKYAVYGSPYERAWKDHKKACYKEIARRWCEANGLAHLCEEEQPGE